MIDPPRFREAMSRLGAAVNVITSDGVAGRSGFTASAVCSVTDTPPTLLVCMNRSSRSYPSFVENGVLCVNTLGPAHQELSRVFSSKTDMDTRFAAATWITLATSSPVLADASVAFDCRIADIAEVGSHGIFYCTVLDVHLGEQRSGLIYLNRRYHDLVWKTE